MASDEGREAATNGPEQNPRYWLDQAEKYMDWYETDAGDLQLLDTVSQLAIAEQLDRIAECLERHEGRRSDALERARAARDARLEGGRG